MGVWNFHRLNYWSVFNPPFKSMNITPPKKKREKTVQISTRVPISVSVKIKNRADQLYQGKTAMAAREILCNATKDLP